MARFGNGFTGRHVPTLGELRFSSMRREVYVQNEDGTRSDVVKERTYDLKSKTQGRMIQVSIPASVPVRDYPYNAVVDLVGAKFGAVAHATFGDNADVDWYIRRRISYWSSPNRLLRRTAGSPPSRARTTRRRRKRK